MRGEFLLKDDVVFLNHGSFGACPREVFEIYQAWQRELERTQSENVYKNSAETSKHWQAEYAEMKELFTTLGLAKPPATAP